MKLNAAPSMGRNVVWNIGEVVVVAGTLFLTYRIILQMLGVEALGLWSLVGGIVALSRFADVGVSAGLPSRMSERSNEGPSPQQWLLTALVINAATYLALAAAVWVGGSLFLSTLSSPEGRQAFHLLPFCAIAFAANGIGTTTGFALIGLRRSDIKSALVISGSIIQIVSAFLLIPSLGLAGLASAQIIQAAFYTTAGMIASYFLLSRARTSATTTAFSTRAAKELIGFGARIQTLNIAGFLYEPLTRFAIASVGGLYVLGIYELSSKVILQARQIAVVPAQNLLAVFSNRPTMHGSRRSYADSFAITATAGFVLMSGAAISSPIVSLLWLGSLNWTFIAMTIALGIGWAINISAVPAYYLGISAGVLKWNILGMAVAALLSPVLVLIMGRWGGAALAVGPSLGIALAAAITHQGASRILKTRHLSRLVRRRVGHGAGRHLKAVRATLSRRKSPLRTRQCA